MNTIIINSTTDTVKSYKTINKLINTFMNDTSRQSLTDIESNLIANILIYVLDSLKNDFNFTDDNLIEFINKVHQNINSEPINDYLELSSKLISLPITESDVKFNIDNGCDYK